jgi:hypothetical protein
VVTDRTHRTKDDGGKANNGNRPPEKLTAATFFGARTHVSGYFTGNRFR